MELREALTQIAEIRRQMARTEVFRGFRSVPVAFSGAVAWAIALAQRAWLPDPNRDLPGYLTLWIGAALVGIGAAGVEMAFRARRSPAWSREITWLAVEQFLPSLLAGALTTFVIVRCSEELAWILPGLWSIFFSLGIFASCRLLPRATFGVAVFYLVAGLATLALARGEWALSPWAMGIPFGVGQLLAAAVFYQALESSHDPE